MRVVFAAVLDGFACARADCACRRSLCAAATDQAASGFPFDDTHKALLGGAAALAHGGAQAAGDVEAVHANHPISAIATPQGVELSFSSLCPTVRALLASNREPVTLATAQGGWRHDLQVFHPDGGLREVRLTGRKSVPWSAFASTREAVLDLVAEPTLPLLARLARVAALLDAALTEKSLPVPQPPLTARGFLAFRGFVESRTASAPTEAMARFASDALALWGDELTLTSSDMPALLDGLGGDWRSHFRTWIVPAERDIAPAIEAWLGARIFAIPLDRDQSIARGYAEFFEGFAIGLRYAAALCAIRSKAADARTLVAALALGEHFVAAAAEPLPSFEAPRDVHERGPRMADLDMTLESIC